MNRYVLTSVHYTGSVIFEYNADGLLLLYSAIDADLNDTQLVGLLKKLPREEQDLTKLNETKYFDVKKDNADISFKGWWATVSPKIHPHRCEPVWNKMSTAKRLSAIKGQQPYYDYCERKNIARVNPENYLKKEYWRTDWRKEI